MTACPAAHPLRDAEGRPQRDLEVIGAHGDACWVRCRKCGRWFWLETDTGKIGVQSERELDHARAEEVLSPLRQPKDPNAVVALLTSHGLPHGPLWELPSARAGLLAALTPGATASARIEALRAASVDGVWAAALAQLESSSSAATRNITVGELPFAIDLRGDLSSLRGCFELEGAVFLYRDAPPYRAIRITQDAIVDIPLAARPRHQCHRDDALMLRLASETEASLLLLGKTEMVPLPLPDLEPRFVASLDAGHFLLCRFPVGNGDRTVEIRDRALAFVASYRIWLPHHESQPSLPRRVDSGWLASNVLADDGEPIALVLFDARFQVVARSYDLRGPRHHLLPLGEGRFTARPEPDSFLVELWSRRGATLVLDHRVESRASCLIGDTLVVLDRSGGVRGLAPDGTVRWSARFDVRELAYGFRVGASFLVYGGSRATLFDARDGCVLAAIDEPFDLRLAVDRQRNGYLFGGPSVIRIRDGKVERTELDKAYRFATTLEDALVLGDPDIAGRYLVLGADGAIRGQFHAPKWQSSVVGTRGGPYVLEPDRLRIGALALR